MVPIILCGICLAFAVMAAFSIEPSTIVCAIFWVLMAAFFFCERVRVRIEVHEENPSHDPPDQL